MIRGWRCSAAFISGFTISFFDLSSPQKFNLSNNLLLRHGRQSKAVTEKLTKYSGIPIGSVTGVQFTIIICQSALCEVVALGSAGTTTPVQGGWLYKRHPQGCISSPPQQVGTVASFPTCLHTAYFVVFLCETFWISQVGCTEVSFQGCLHTAWSPLSCFCLLPLKQQHRYHSHFSHCGKLSVCLMKYYFRIYVWESGAYLLFVTCTTCSAGVKISRLVSKNSSNNGYFTTKRNCQL